MGRPLKKSYFGTGTATEFTVHARLSTGAAAYGFIVKQTATKHFQVNVGGTVEVCVLVDKEVADLAANEMTISCQDVDGNVKRFVKLANHVGTLNDGTISAWSFAAATDGVVEAEATGDTFSAPVVAPVITITAQPAAASVTAPATATFTVTATVTQGATLTYQWTKGGTTITGATSASYTTPATSAGDDGSVFAVVVSAVGATSVTSNNATLSVASAPVT